MIDNPCIIETFNSELEARTALELLNYAGISADVLTSETGGAYPGLQMETGVCLIVSEDDLEKAEEILEEL